MFVKSTNPGKVWDVSVMKLRGVVTGHAVEGTSANGLFSFDVFGATRISVPTDFTRISPRAKQAALSAILAALNERGLVAVKADAPPALAA